VLVEVHAENPISGEVTHTNSAYVVYIALGDDGRPASVPPLAITNELEQKRFEAGAERQQRRLAARE
jgi:acyl-CoA hydrolase